ncbi:hypothetical protein [Botrimarina sp.]|uniref:CAP domain-containing protein n=1 Tax=Botrimarina sp. TaxID=2795802 RepID=UPI0032ED016C
MRFYFLIAAAAVASGAAPASAQTLWFEGGESGLAGVIDGTSSGYPLLQDSVVAEGRYAFHLANPNATTEWFVVDPDVSPLADSKLFFLSRLGGATSEQTARVEVSTNGGGSWSPIYTQPGAGYPGEGAFSQRAVDLAPYAGLDVSLRFGMHFSVGTYFPQSSVDAGWIVDSIQIGDTPQKLRYAIGEPTAKEQLMLEHVNRSRADALAEAQRLAGSTDPDITSAMQYFGVTPQGLVSSFQDNVSSGLIDRHAQPLAFEGALVEAARLHSQDQLENAFQGHYSSSDPPAPFLPGYSPTARVRALGYASGVAENVYAYGESVEHAHAGFDIDWGVPSLGHRITIHNDVYKEVGIGIVEGRNGQVGPLAVTQNFGAPRGVAYITGVVFEDLDGDAFYDEGEGRGGVTVDVVGSPYFAVTSDSGGYAVPVSADGSYQVSFSGGGFEDYFVPTSIAGLRNTKVDYLAVVASGLAGDFNNDGRVDAADYTVWRDALGAEYGAADYQTWAAAYGRAEPSATVPEPGAAALAAAGVAALVVRRVRRANA